MKTVLKIMKGTFLVGILMSVSSVAAIGQTTPQEGPPKGKQGPPPSFESLISKMDANKDGKLSMSEVEGPLKEDFVRVDTDKDGFISEDEFVTGAPEKKKKR